MMFRYYELATDMPMRDINTMRQDIAEGKRHPMETKAELAALIISLYHGDAAAKAAREEFNRVFRNRETPEDIEVRELPPRESTRVTKLLASLGLAASVSEAGRLVESGAVHINDARISNIKAELNLAQNGEYLFKVGKRRFLKLIIK
jgi:tyrosyl-tRNA synthetase